MKKILLVLVFIMGTVSFADSIGYIDSQSILKQFNKSINAQTELAQQQKELQDFIADKQKELEQAKADGKSESELMQIKQDLEEEIQPKQKQLIDLNQKLSVEIEDDIIKKTKEVAKQLRIDVVLDKQVVLYGGSDLTSLVLSKLNRD